MNGDGYAVIECCVVEDVDEEEECRIEDPCL